MNYKQEIVNWTSAFTIILAMIGYAISLLVFNNENFGIACGIIMLCALIPQWLYAFTEMPTRDILASSAVVTFFVLLAYLAYLIFSGEVNLYQNFFTDLYCYYTCPR